MTIGAVDLSLNQPRQLSLDTVGPRHLGYVKYSTVSFSVICRLATTEAVVAKDARYSSDRRGLFKELKATYEQKCTILPCMGNIENIGFEDNNLYF